MKIKKNSKVGEAGAELDAVLGLQRSSTNRHLQTAPTESQMPTVAAGPGSFTFYKKFIYFDKYSL